MQGRYFLSNCPWQIDACIELRCESFPFMDGRVPTIFVPCGANAGVIVPRLPGEGR